MIACAMPSVDAFQVNIFQHAFAIRIQSDQLDCLTDSFARDFPANHCHQLQVLKSEYSGKKPGVSMIAPISSGMSISFPTLFSIYFYSFPDVGLIKPSIIFISTVFPEPFLPTKPYIFPGIKYARHIRYYGLRAKCFCQIFDFYIASFSVFWYNINKFTL